MMQMRKGRGVLEPSLMSNFPSGTAAGTFSEWVANHVGLEQLLGLAGFLSPEFFEVEGHVFWDRYVAERLEQTRPLHTPFGDDPVTIERYFNTINLGEFFLASADEAVHQEQLLQAFGHVLREFWGHALRVHFPESEFRFEIAPDLFNEEGLCFTFWRVRP
jgi:hypothetical protein